MSSTLGCMKRRLGVGLLVAVLAVVGALAGVALAGPGCPDRPGVCAPADDLPHDAGNVLDS